MIARIAILGLLLCALIAGAALYYLQVFAYYSRVEAADVGNVQLTDRESGSAVPIMFENFQGIDSASSPIRFRACFQTPIGLAELRETYVVYEAPEPLVAPRWFDCFDAGAIGTALERGEATAFLGVENVTYGIDRVVAVFPDGRAFAWHQINPCGEVVFDGNPAPEGCPPAPERLQGCPTC